MVKLHPSYKCQNCDARASCKGLCQTCYNYHARGAGKRSQALIEVLDAKHRAIIEAARDKARRLGLGKAHKNR